MTGGRDIAPIINNLLSLPFALKIATQDFHPQDHVSFETSHPAPHIKAFESSVNISNPHDENQSYEIPIWPAHCVQGTGGAELIPEIDVSRFDHVVAKGKDRRVEMFSAFADCFGNKSSIAASMDLAETLSGAGITHVFIVGLAGDYCVRCTALDAKKMGFQVFVIEEAVKSIDAGEKGWGSTKEQLRKVDIGVIHLGDPELKRIMNISSI